MEYLGAALTPDELVAKYTTSATNERLSYAQAALQGIPFLKSSDMQTIRNDIPYEDDYINDHLKESIYLGKSATKHRAWLMVHNYIPPTMKSKWYHYVPLKPDLHTLGCEDNLMGISRTNKPSWNTINYKYYAIPFRLNYVPKLVYYASLDMETDPIEYIRKLALWKSAGLCLLTDKLYCCDLDTYIKADTNQTHLKELNKTWIGSSVKGGGIVKLKNTPEDRAAYSQYVLRFIEVMSLSGLHDALDYRKLSLITDKAYLDNAQTKLIQAQQTIPASMNVSLPIVVTDFVNWKHFTSSIPASGFNVTVPGIGSVPPRQALLNIWMQLYEPLITEALNTISMQLGRVESGTVEQTEWHKTLQNPFLSFDAAKSVKQGAPVFVDTSVLGTKGKWAQGYQKTVQIGTKKDLNVLLAAPDERVSKLRNILLSSGGFVSQNDLDNTSEPNNTLLWVGAAVAAAAGIASVSG